MVLSSIDFVFGGGLFYVVPFEGVCTLLLRITYLTSWCTVILILKKFLSIIILNLHIHTFSRKGVNRINQCLFELRSNGHLGGHSMTTWTQFCPFLTTTASCPCSLIECPLSTTMFYISVACLWSKVHMYKRVGRTEFGCFNQFCTVWFLSIIKTCIFFLIFVSHDLFLTYFR